MIGQYRSYEDWQALLLDTLGDRVMSTTEVHEAIVDKTEDDEYLASRESVYNYLQRMTWSGILSREPTGLPRPKFRYFKTERPVTGEFADIVAGVTLEAPE